MLDLHHFFGDAPGPRLLFLAGVHGDEKPGVVALDRLAADLNSGAVKLLKGELLVVPRVNAAALAARRHFLDENLNRVVRAHASPATREQAIANDLLPLLDASDAVLDLHGTPAPTVPFVFLDDESAPNRAWAETLGAPYLLAGWPALYQGGGSTTTEYAQSKGKRALTVEVGQNDDLAAADLAVAFALRSLVHFGMITPVSPAGPSRELRLKSVIRREREGTFVREWKNFDAVKKGDALTRYADGAVVSAPFDAFVVMPYSAAALGEEWLYLAS